MNLALSLVYGCSDYCTNLVDMAADIVWAPGKSLMWPSPLQWPQTTQGHDNIMRDDMTRTTQWSPPPVSPPHGGFLLQLTIIAPSKHGGLFILTTFVSSPPCVLHGKRFILLFFTLIFLLPLCVLCEGGFSYFLFFCCLCPAPWHFAWAEFHSLFYQFVAPLPRILYKMQGWLYYYVFLKKVLLIHYIKSG